MGDGGKGFEPATNDEAVAALVSTGASESSAEHIVNWLKSHGPLFRKLGVEEKVIQFTCLLHNGSWTKLDKSEMWLVTRCGGRQGCRFGAIVSNLIHSISLEQVREELANKDVALHLNFDIEQLFTHTGGNTSIPSTHVHNNGAAKTVVEDEFVDDATFLLQAECPELLNSAIDKLTTALFRNLHLMSFRVNFKAGKTEAFLHYPWPDAITYWNECVKHDVAF